MEYAKTSPNKFQMIVIIQSSYLKVIIELEINYRMITIMSPYI